MLRSQSRGEALAVKGLSLRQAACWAMKGPEKSYREGALHLASLALSPYTNPWGARRKHAGRSHCDEGYD
jgi:hypothetical protein